MAWLFGTSKKKQPEVYVAREADGFSIVSANPQIDDDWRRGTETTGGSLPRAGMPPYPIGPSYPLYPSLPGGHHQQGPPPPLGPPYLAICPQAPPGYVPHHLSSSPPSVSSHPLDSIPFKLSTGLEQSTGLAAKQGLETLERARSLLDRIQERLDSGQYCYSFDLERGVLREIAAR